MYIQGVDSVYDLVWRTARWVKPPTATCSIRTKWSIHLQLRIRGRGLPVHLLRAVEKEAQQLLALENPLPLPAYDVF